jgi:anti-sigma regulatory factor (Ser/Thr protein kinase)
MTQIRIVVTEQNHTAMARRAAVELAQSSGMDETTVGHIALLVTELATNLVKHATKGELLIRMIGNGETEGVEILSLDGGPGIADVGRSLDDGYSTAGSPGTGLGAVMRTASEFDLYSQQGKGTAVVARLVTQRQRKSVVSKQAVGVVHQPVQGESISGDAWVVRDFADGSICGVVDGLGHGRIAAEAAAPIIETVRTVQQAMNPVALIEAAHQAARPTRGAAFGVAVIEGEAGKVRFAGIGNVAAVVVDGDRRRHLVSYSGILGQGYHKVAEFTHPWSPTAALVLHSDGIATHWDLGQYPGLAARDPSLIAGVLYRDFTRGRDDATVIVVKNKKQE